MLEVECPVAADDAEIVHSAVLVCLPASSKPQALPTDIREETVEGCAGAKSALS